MSVSILGTRVIRTEDPRFLTSGGVYTDDMRLPGACHVHFVRSAVAHAHRVRVHNTGGPTKSSTEIGRAGPPTCRYGTARSQRTSPAGVGAASVWAVHQASSRS